MKKYSKNISTLESAIILELIIFARSNVKMSSSAAMMEKNAMKKRLLMRSTPGKAVENHDDNLFELLGVQLNDDYLY